MEDDRLDLSALDPAADRLRWERLIRDVMRRAEPELTRRTTGTGVLGMLGNWAWPTLSAAAVAAIMSGAALALNRAQSEPVMVGSLIEAFHLPEPVSTWLDEDRSPERADLVLLIQQGDNQ
jgi:anti-sigma-K factor RskA